MRLQIENYPTPQGTCDVVDLDRDGGEGRPLIVARFFEPEYAKAFVALPELVAAAKAALVQHNAGVCCDDRAHWTPPALRLDSAIKAAEGE